MLSYRVRNALLAIHVLYVASFILPFTSSRNGYTPAGLLFFLTLYLGVLRLVPGFLLAWGANILLWASFSAIHCGKAREAAKLGIAAVVASLPAMPFGLEPMTRTSASSGIGGFWMVSGYFAWMLAIIAQAVLSVVVACHDETGQFRLQIKLRWVMVAVAAAALLMAGWRVVFAVLFWSPWSAGGLGMPD